MTINQKPMKNQKPKSPWGENLFLFILSFILLRTLFALIWDVRTASTHPAPYPESTNFSGWWNAFFNKFSNTSTWADSIIGVLIGALIPILFALVKLSFPYIEKSQQYIQTKIEIIIFKINSQIDIGIDFLQKRVAQAATFSGRIVEKTLLFISNLVLLLWKIIATPLRWLWAIAVAIFNWLWSSIKSPKWYKQIGAIDPGLIEVSLAVTAIAVAIPALSKKELLGYGWLRIISVAIPTAISLSFIDLYTKSKGSKSLFILTNPFEDGPFFFLGWAIVLGAIFAIVVFASSG